MSYHATVVNVQNIKRKDMVIQTDVATSENHHPKI